MGLKGVVVNGVTHAFDYAYLENKPAVDASPTNGSANAVSSGGVHSALAAKADASSTYSKGEIDAALQGKQDRLALDNAPTQGSDNPVKSGGVYAALAAKQPMLAIDPVPTQGSQNPVSSGGVCAALAGKQNDLAQAPSVSSLLETDYLFLERGGAICKIRASAVIIPSGSGGGGIEAGDGSAILTEDGQEILPDGVAM